MDKPLRDMTDAELLAEWQKRNEYAQLMLSWGWHGDLPEAQIHAAWDAGREMAKRPVFKHGIAKHV